jgi:hypothetical protein
MLTPTPSIMFATPRAGRGGVRRAAIAAAVFIPCLVLVGRSAGVAMALYVTACVVTLSVLNRRAARPLYFVDAERRRAEHDLRRAHGELDRKSVV